MFRLLPKLPVESYLACKQIATHTINTNRLFPSITKKSLIQSWKPKSTHLIKLPIECIRIEETTPSGSIWKRLEDVGKDLSSILLPTRETIDKWTGKLITRQNRKNQFAVRTAGKIRKPIGYFQRAYFRTDVIDLCDCKDGNKNADPKSFRKQRKSPKKKLGGQCPYIKEECLQKSGDQSKKKTKGSKHRGEKCSRAVPCGKKGTKTDANEQKKSKTCGKAENKSKETTCSQKKQDDTCNKGKSSTQAAYSSKVDSCKKTKPTTNAPCKEEKAICSSKDDNCKKIKSSTKGCDKGKKPVCSSPNTTCKKKSSDSSCSSNRSYDCSAKDQKTSCASKKSSGGSAKPGKDVSCASLLKKKEKKPQKKKSCQAMEARCSKQKGSCGAVKKKLICSKKKRAIASEMKTCKPKLKDKKCRTAEKKSRKCTKETSCPVKEDTEKLTQCKKVSSSSCASTKCGPSNENKKKCTQPRKASSDPCAGKKSTEKGCPSKDKPNQCRKASSDSAAGNKLPPKRCPSKDNDGKCKLAFTTKETPKEADICSAKASSAKQTRSCCKADRLRSSCKSKAAPQFDFTVPNLCQGLPPKERKKCEVQRDRWMMLKEAWLKQWSKKRC